MTFFLWSKTAASNSTADSTINWAEGQAPSTVNDSGRAMMAAAAKFRDDISGSIATAGTSTAYTITTNEVFTSLAAMDGKIVTFVLHATNGAAPTLAVDGLAAKPIVSSFGVAVGAGSLLVNSVHSAVYNNANNEFRLIGAYDALMAPSGTVMLFQQTAAPTGWTKSTTHNDKALRIVSGTAGTGGSVAFSTLFGRTGTDAVTLAQANVPNYNLSLAGLSWSGSVSIAAAATGISASWTGQAGGAASGAGSFFQNTGVGAVTVNISDPTHGHAGSTVSGSVGGTLPSGGSSVAFTPTIDCRVLFVDCILATKN